VAKTIAIARKNFMFSDTPAGAVDAILDRLMHNAHKLKLTPGRDSMRRIYSEDID